MDRTQACGACDRGSIPLEGVDMNISPDVVKNVMSRYVPEKEQKNLASDQIARIIGF